MGEGRDREGEGREKGGTGKGRGREKGGTGKGRGRETSSIPAFLQESVGHQKVLGGVHCS